MINGKILRDAIISGANNIQNNRQLVDSLNVFPVPDGDTGTNMSMTIGSAKRELELMKDDAGCDVVSKTAASALLRGARGNSGVILSLLFRGISKGLKGKEEIDKADFAEALTKGVEGAYKAVMQPTEGTILTVSRAAAEKAVEIKDEEMEIGEFFTKLCEAANEMLLKTPDMLPVLKKAGVVDSGAKGFTVILEGMTSVIRDGVIIPLDGEGEKTSSDAGEVKTGLKVEHTYMVEFTVLKEEKNNEHNALTLRAYLESLADGVEVADNADTIVCKANTDHPGKAVEKALSYGQLINVNIENMRHQAEEDKEAAKGEKKAEEKKESLFPYAPVEKGRKYGFVSVCAGDGIADLFKDLGVDNIVSGGQTMNPSTEDILAAVEATPAETVFVLPNNKNIIMAAEQAVNLADRKVFVLHTKTIPQGLTAMLSFDEGADEDCNFIEMTKATERVATGQVTFAARDSDFDGHKIKKDEILAIENGKLAFVDRDTIKAASRLAKILVKKVPECSFVTVIYGEGVTEDQAEEVADSIRAKYKDDIEVAVVKGNQPVYYFIISAE